MPKIEAVCGDDGAQVTFGACIWGREMTMETKGNSERRVYRHMALKTKYAGRDDTCIEKLQRVANANVSVGGSTQHKRNIVY